VQAKLLIADDHEIVLEGIRTLVSRSGRPWEICGEARNGKDAVEMVKTLHPDVAVLDVSMPIMSGLEAARQITRLKTECKVLIFTMHEWKRLGAEARESGAHGYVLKAQAAQDLVRAIDCLLAGNTFFGAGPKPEIPKKAEKKPGGWFRLAYRLT